MIQYCGRFIPNLATVSAPLRVLTHKDVKWVWTSREQHAFETLKTLLTADIVMGYFDYSKNTELYVDASPFGLGAILTQMTPGKDDTNVISYASRSLTDTETRYSQIEREALAIEQRRSVIRHHEQPTSSGAFQPPTFDDLKKIFQAQL